MKLMTKTKSLILKRQEKPTLEYEKMKQYLNESLDFKKTILTISGSFTVAIPLRKRDASDGCANLHQSFVSSSNSNTTLTINYEDVIESLKGIYKDFYIFLDEAKEPAAQGFKFRSIDLISELDNILKKNYTTDYDFFSDVVQLHVDLKDGHTTFTPSCYSAFFFFQDIWLYSTVDCHGTQVIKILQDDLDSSNDRCEVTHIDGTPALEAIKTFADKHIKNSRDLGVRFNMALASLRFFNDSITYKLNCNGSKKTLTRPWRILSNNSTNTFNYTDSNSYFQSMSSEIVNTVVDGNQTNNLQNFTIFFKKNDTGIIVVPNFLPSSYATDQIAFQAALIDAMNQFVQTGVKKLVIDFISNGGGFVPLAQFFNEIFLRQKNFAFPRDIRMNDVTTFLIEQADKLGLGANTINFSPNQEQSFTTGKPFGNASEFIGNNKFTRGGVTSNFSNLFVDIFDESALSNWQSPWKNKDIIILTNGACSSSCAQTAQYLSEQAKIATVAVGGLYNTSMSYSSFPGGNVVAVNSFYNQINLIISNTTDTAPQIPKNFATDIDMFTSTFTFSETHDLDKPDQINEFQYRPADYRIYYDDESILSPSNLWEQAVKFIS
ncbi:6032_t:CDS:2 [Scutellospora calospora]|uniref:6032_t:CDS:1 n=1 Tax=Scutellospora calospora TaxID=85575 RepID=A0ACA9KUY4_9GLOM|nr:6032_t:CDS:2 [Scutellospora calospora]